MTQPRSRRATTHVRGTSPDAGELSHTPQDAHDAPVSRPPLVPSEVNLRGLPWMRLDTSRLLDSDLFALSTGAEFKAAVALWCKSWSQEPAGSLPADDRVLAHLSGAGARWNRVKSMALRGWSPADDGRLYHAVVAEQVLAAWEERTEFRAELDNRNERKRRERGERADMFRELKAMGRDLPWNTPTGTLRDLLRDLSQPVTPDPVTGHGDSHGLDGTGRDGTLKASIRTPARASNSTQVAEAHALALRGIGYSECSPMHPDLVAAAGEGVTPEELVSAAKGKSDKPIAYLVAAARGKRGDAAERQVNGSAPPAPPPQDPQAVARAKAEQLLDDELRKIRHDCDTLGLTAPDERDRRLAAARERARQANGGSVSCH